MHNQSPLLTTPIDDQEWQELLTQWPNARRQHVRLQVDSPFLTERHQRLLSDGRRAEVCYIAYEGNPQNGLLLHIKTIYPETAYRLPTGGIHPGERVWDTLLREIPEETGLVVGDEADQVHIRDLLGVLSYDFDHASNRRSYAFATYHFLVEFPPQAELVPEDETERIGGWRWYTPQELATAAETLATIETSAPYWRDWGRFRAVSHRFVYDALR